MLAGSRMSLLQLPAESLDRIFRLLPLDNLACLMLVCTRFRQVVKDTVTTVTIDTTVTTGTGESGDSSNISDSNDKLTLLLLVCLGLRR